MERGGDVFGHKAMNAEMLLADNEPTISVRIERGERNALLPSAELVISQTVTINAKGPRFCEAGESVTVSHMRRKDLLELRRQIDAALSHKVLQPSADEQEEEDYRAQLEGQEVEPCCTSTGGRSPTL